jgi:hypothetical protein
MGGIEAGSKDYFWNISEKGWILLRGLVGIEWIRRKRLEESTFPLQDEKPEEHGEAE